VQVRDDFDIAVRSGALRQETPLTWNPFLRYRGRGSIDQATGWTGADGLRTTFEAPAAIPGAKRDGRALPVAFVVFPKVTVPMDQFCIGPRSAAGADARARYHAHGDDPRLCQHVRREPNLVGDIVAKGAFTRTLREHRSEGTSPAMLWAHPMDEPIGRWTDLREDEKGLEASGILNLNSTRGREGSRTSRPATSPVSRSPT